MMNHKNIWILLSVLLAVGLPLLNAHRYQADLASYPVVRFEIEPYDPRDLLYGHYLQFRIRWNWDEDSKALPPERANARDICLCIGQGEIDPPVHAVECAALRQKEKICAHSLRGGNYYANPSADEGGVQDYTSPFNRYYVDERYALALERVFRDGKEKFHIGLSMRGNGKAAVENLYVGGTPLSEYVRANPGLLKEKQNP